MLFYTGNEGNIVDFWVNTGFVFELAQKLKGLVVFGEHVSYNKIFVIDYAVTLFVCLFVDNTIQLKISLFYVTCVV